MSPVQQMAEEISSKKYYETVFAQILENNKAHSFPMKDNFFFFNATVHFSPEFDLRTRGS